MARTSAVVARVALVFLLISAVVPPTFASPQSFFIFDVGGLSMCFPFFLILALLFAALYAQGKSPLAFFDITSPKKQTLRQYRARQWALQTPSGVTMRRAFRELTGGLTTRAMTAGLALALRAPGRLGNLLVRGASRTILGRYIYQVKDGKQYRLDQRTGTLQKYDASSGKWVVEKKLSSGELLKARREGIAGLLAERKYATGGKLPTGFKVTVETVPGEKPGELKKVATVGRESGTTTRAVLRFGGGAIETTARGRVGMVPGMSPLQADALHKQFLQAARDLAPLTSSIPLVGGTFLQMRLGTRLFGNFLSNTVQLGRTTHMMMKAEKDPRLKMELENNTIKMTGGQVKKLENEINNAKLAITYATMRSEGKEKAEKWLNDLNLKETTKEVIRTLASTAQTEAGLRSLNNMIWEKERQLSGYSDPRGMWVPGLKRIYEKAIEEYTRAKLKEDAILAKIAPGKSYEDLSPTEKTAYKREAERIYAEEAAKKGYAPGIIGMVEANMRIWRDYYAGGPLQNKALSHYLKAENDVLAKQKELENAQKTGDEKKITKAMNEYNEAVRKRDAYDIGYNSAKMQKLETDLKGLEGKRETLNGDLSRLNKNLSDLEKKISAASDSEKISLQKAKNEYETSKAVLENEIKKLDSEIGKLQGEITKTGETIQQLRERIGEHKSPLDHYRESAGEWTYRVESVPGLTKMPVDSSAYVLYYGAKYELAKKTSEAERAEWAAKEFDKIADSKSAAHVLKTMVNIENVVAPTFVALKNAQEKMKDSETNVIKLDAEIEKKNRETEKVIQNTEIALKEKKWEEIRYQHVKAASEKGTPEEKRKEINEVLNFFNNENESVRKVANKYSEDALRWAKEVRQLENQLKAEEEKSPYLEFKLSQARENLAHAQELQKLYSQEAEKLQKMQDELSKIEPTKYSDYLKTYEKSYNAADKRASEAENYRNTFIENAKNEVTNLSEAKAEAEYNLKLNQDIVQQLSSTIEAGNVFYWQDIMSNAQRAILETSTRIAELESAKEEKTIDPAKIDAELASLKLQREMAKDALETASTSLKAIPDKVLSHAFAQQEQMEKQRAIADFHAAMGAGALSDGVIERIDNVLGIGNDIKEVEAYRKLAKNPLDAVEDPNVRLLLESQLGKETLQKFEGLASISRKLESPELLFLTGFTKEEEALLTDVLAVSKKEDLAKTIEAISKVIASNLQVLDGEKAKSLNSLGKQIKQISEQYMAGLENASSILLSKKAGEKLSAEEAKKINAALNKLKDNISRLKNASSILLSKKAGEKLSAEDTDGIQHVSDFLRFDLGREVSQLLISKKAGGGLSAEEVKRIDTALNALDITKVDKKQIDVIKNTFKKATEGLLLVSKEEQSEYDKASQLVAQKYESMRQEIVSLAGGESAKILKDIEGTTAERIRIEALQNSIRASSFAGLKAAAISELDALIEKPETSEKDKKDASEAKALFATWTTDKAFGASEEQKVRINKLLERATGIKDFLNLVDLTRRAPLLPEGIEVEIQKIRVPGVREELDVKGRRFYTTEDFKKFESDLYNAKEAALRVLDERSEKVEKPYSQLVLLIGEAKAKTALDLLKLKACLDNKLAFSEDRWNTLVSVFKSDEAKAKIEEFRKHFIREEGKVVVPEDVAEAIQKAIKEFVIKETESITKSLKKGATEKSQQINTLLTAQSVLNSGRITKQIPLDLDSRAKWLENALKKKRAELAEATNELAKAMGNYESNKTAENLDAVSRAKSKRWQIAREIEMLEYGLYKTAKEFEYRVVRARISQHYAYTDTQRRKIEIEKEFPEFKERYDALEEMKKQVSEAYKNKLLMSQYTLEGREKGKVAVLKRFADKLVVPKDVYESWYHTEASRFERVMASSIRGGLIIGGFALATASAIAVPFSMPLLIAGGSLLTARAGMWVTSVVRERSRYDSILKDLVYLQHQSALLTTRSAGLGFPIEHPVFQAIKKREAFRALKVIQSGERAGEVVAVPFSSSLRPATYHVLSLPHEIIAREFFENFGVPLHSRLRWDYLKSMIGEQRALKEFLEGGIQSPYIDPSYTPYQEIHFITAHERQPPLFFAQNPSVYRLLSEWPSSMLTPEEWHTRAVGRMFEPGVLINYARIPYMKSPVSAGSAVLYSSQSASGLPIRLIAVEPPPALSSLGEITARKEAASHSENRAEAIRKMIDALKAQREQLEQAVKEGKEPEEALKGLELQLNSLQKALVLPSEELALPVGQFTAVRVDQLHDLRGEDLIRLSTALNELENSVKSLTAQAEKLSAGIEKGSVTPSDAIKSIGNIKKSVENVGNASNNASKALNGLTLHNMQIESSDSSKKLSGEENEIRNKQTELLKTESKAVENILSTIDKMRALLPLDANVPAQELAEKNRNVLSNYVNSLKYQESAVLSHMLGYETKQSVLSLIASNREEEMKKLRKALDAMIPKDSARFQVDYLTGKIISDATAADRAKLFEYTIHPPQNLEEITQLREKIAKTDKEMQAYANLREIAESNIRKGVSEGKIKPEELKSARTNWYNYVPEEFKGTAETLNNTYKDYFNKSPEYEKAVERLFAERIGLEKTQERLLNGSIIYYSKQLHKDVREGVKELFGKYKYDAFTKKETALVDGKEVVRLELADDWQERVKDFVEVAARLVELDNDISSDTLARGRLYAKADKKGIVHYEREPINTAIEKQAGQVLIRDDKGNAYEGCGYGRARVTIPVEGGSLIAKFNNLGDLEGWELRKGDNGVAADAKGKTSDMANAKARLESAARETNAIIIYGKAPVRNILGEIVGWSAESYTVRNLALGKSAEGVEQEIRLPDEEINNRYNVYRTRLFTATEFIRVKREGEFRNNYANLLGKLKSGFDLTKDEWIDLGALNKLINGEQATLESLLTIEGAMGDKTTTISGIVNVAHSGNELLITRKYPISITMHKQLADISQAITKEALSTLQKRLEAELPEVGKERINELINFIQPELTNRFYTAGINLAVEFQITDLKKSSSKTRKEFNSRIHELAPVLASAVLEELGGNVNEKLSHVRIAYGNSLSRIQNIRSNRESIRLSMAQEEEKELTPEEKEKYITERTEAIKKFNSDIDMLHAAFKAISGKAQSITSTEQLEKDSDYKQLMNSLNDAKSQVAKVESLDKQLKTNEAEKLKTTLSMVEKEVADTLPGIPPQKPPETPAAPPAQTEKEAKPSKEELPVAQPVQVPSEKPEKLPVAIPIREEEVQSAKIITPITKEGIEERIEEIDARLAEIEKELRPVGLSLNKIQGLKEAVVTAYPPAKEELLKTALDGLNDKLKELGLKDEILKYWEKNIDTWSKEHPPVEKLDVASMYAYYGVVNEKIGDVNGDPNLPKALQLNKEKDKLETELVQLKRLLEKMTSEEKKGETGEGKEAATEGQKEEAGGKEGQKKAEEKTTEKKEAVKPKEEKKEKPTTGAEQAAPVQAEMKPPEVKKEEAQQPPTTGAPQAEKKEEEKKKEEVQQPPTTRAAPTEVTKKGVTHEGVKTMQVVKPEIKEQHLTLDEVMGKAGKRRYDEEMNLLAKAMDLFDLEEARGRVEGKPWREGKLVHLPAEGEVIVVGDIHSRTHCLETILKETNFVERVGKGEKVYLLCLGDYIDRPENESEPSGVKVLDILLELKLAFPDNVILLAGNHEMHRKFAVSPHEFLGECRNLFRDKGWEAHKKYDELFMKLPIAAKAPNGVLFIHGGITDKIGSEKDLVNPTDDALCELVWNDPETNKWQTKQGYFGPSSRGGGIRVFGEEAFNRFMEDVGSNVLVRAHQQKVEAMFNNRLLTLNSTDYKNAEKAYVVFDLAKPVRSTADIDINSF